MKQATALLVALKAKVMFLLKWTHEFAAEDREWTRNYGPVRVQYGISDKWHWGLLEITVMFLWVCGSVFLVCHLWGKHPNDSIFKKLVWTIVLVVPLLGWMLYGQFYGESSDREGRTRGSVRY